MKTVTRKSIVDEVGFVLAVILTFAVLVTIIFPLFIIALPMVLIAGCRGIWKVDHIPDRT